MASALLPFVLAAASYLDPTDDHAIVATAIANVVESEPPLFRDDQQRRRTASLVLAVAFREGRLRASVLGDCDVKTKEGACIARPHSFCTMQVHDTNGGTPALNDDPEACIRAGIAALRVSMRICPDAPVAFYAAGPGACTNVRAIRISTDRMALARRAYSAAQLQEVATTR